MEMNISITSLLHFIELYEFASEKCITIETSPLQFQYLITTREH